MHFFPLQINTKKVQRQNTKYNKIRNTTTTYTKYKNECPAFHFRSIHKHQLQKDCSLQRTVLCSLQVLCTVLCSLHSIGLSCKRTYSASLIIEKQCIVVFFSSIHYSCPGSRGIYTIQSAIQKYRNTKYRRCTVHCSLPG